MKQYSMVSSLLLLLLAIFACTNDSEEVPDRYTPILDKNNDAPTYQIDIPEAEITDVPYDSVQAIRAPEGAVYAAGLGHRVVATPDSLLVVTDDRKAIKSIDIETGKLLNRFSFLGRGPGEYEYITNLQVTNESVMIADRYLSIVNIYDRTWDLQEEIILEDLDHTSSDSDIFLLNSRLYYPSATDSAHVIRTSNLAGHTDSSISFHRRMIPLNHKPKAYNEAMIDASPTGELLVANYVSPFLFLYQNHELKELFYLELPGLELLHNLTSESTPSGRSSRVTDGTPEIIQPPPVPIDVHSYRMYPFLIDILHTGDNILFYYSNWHAKQFFLTVLGRDSNDRWQHRGSFRFFKDSGEQFSVRTLGYSEPWLYLGNHFEEEILRVDLDELIQWQPESRASSTGSE